mmetsp:Transcript_383/g.1195  ORF Transcript_383/g.1195 Transcript_383/m.1195 type:complete len:200 (-) Transcript_383:1136-1735(-)
MVRRPFESMSNVRKSTRNCVLACRNLCKSTCWICSTRELVPRGGGDQWVARASQKSWYQMWSLPLLNLAMTSLRSSSSSVTPALASMFLNSSASMLRDWSTSALWNCARMSTLRLSKACTIILKIPSMRLFVTAWASGRCSPKNSKVKSSALYTRKRLRRISISSSPAEKAAWLRRATAARKAAPSSSSWMATPVTALW